MSDYQVRRVKKDGAGGSDVLWLLFRTGKIRKPLVVLTDYQMSDLLKQISAEESGDPEMLPR